MATPEAADFAALLKELKDRSGRSYGVLAGRLHVSTSTLHRYCNGDAVPNEYAPVERLARLCGADADELVELHRRWIVADAARRRPASGSVTGPAAGPVPAPVSEPVVAADSEADAESVRESGAAADAGGAESEVVAVGDATAPVNGAAVRPRRLWSSARARIVLATVAVVALSVPTALVAGHLSGSDTDGLSDASAVDKATGLPGSEARASASSAAPDHPSSSPSASGTGTVAPRRSETASAHPSAGHATGTWSGTGVPLSATISSYNWEEPCGQYYVLNQEPNDVPPPPPPQDNRGWAKALGGVDGGQMLLEVTVQGKSDQAVVLHGLHVRQLSRKQPLPWGAYSMGEGCGSGITPQSFDIDLDDSRPTVTPVAGEYAGKPVSAKDFPFRVTSTDVEVFDLDVHVEGHDVSWYLELEWSSGDRKGTLRIDDGGQPFRTSSIETRPQYIYRHDTAQWVTRQ
ncbi:helix-turn-helix domain-containing protein [Streptomyces sp. NPDC052052]|uniref:transcriptional regulator n=1 Tax=Streptomyces sp. NPDC052052 TaxID=3154756 RepID=UPI0034256D34